LDTDAYIDGVRSALRTYGFEVEDAEVAGRTVVAGQRSDFRWRWFASRLHTSVLVAQLHGPEPLDGFLEGATRWAIEHRSGGSLGVQSGVAAIAAIAMGSLGPQARAWAATPHGRRFAAIAYPVAIGAATGEIVQPRRMIIGGIFPPFLHDLVHEVLEAPLRPAVH